MALDRIREADDGLTPAPPRTVVVPATFVVRASSALVQPG
jgi:hypothetical protein